MTKISNIKLNNEINRRRALDAWDLKQKGEEASSEESDEVAFEEACEQDYYRRAEYDQESQDEMAWQDELKG